MEELGLRDIRCSVRLWPDEEGASLYPARTHTPVHVPIAPFHWKTYLRLCNISGAGACTSGWGEAASSRTARPAESSPCTDSMLQRSSPTRQHGLGICAGETWTGSTTDRHARPSPLHNPWVKILPSWHLLFTWLTLIPLLLLISVALKYRVCTTSSCTRKKAGGTAWALLQQALGNVSVLCPQIISTEISSHIPIHSSKYLSEPHTSRIR